MYFWLGFKKLEYLLGICLLVICRKSQENIHKNQYIAFRNGFPQEQTVQRLFGSQTVLFNKL